MVGPAVAQDGRGLVVARAFGKGALLAITSNSTVTLETPGAFGSSCHFAKLEKELQARFG
jgi:hypothetical protein